MPKDENQDLPMEGLEVKKIPSLTAALKKYQGHKSARCEALVLEKAAKAQLLELVHKYEDQLPKLQNGEIYYRSGDVSLTVIKGKEKLKVKDEDDDDDDDE